MRRAQVKHLSPFPLAVAMEDDKDAYAEQYCEQQIHPDETARHVRRLYFI
jgi:hypothetical protein